MKKYFWLLKDGKWVKIGPESLPTSGDSIHLIIDPSPPKFKLRTKLWWKIKGYYYKLKLDKNFVGTYCGIPIFLSPFLTSSVAALEDKQEPPNL